MKRRRSSSGDKGGGDTFGVSKCDEEGICLQDSDEVRGKHLRSGVEERKAYSKWGKW